MKKTTLLALLFFAFFSCKKEDEKPIPSTTLPIITTIAATDIIQFEATAGGIITDNRGTTITARGICWGKFPSPTINEKHTVDSTGLDSFENLLTELTPNTTYHIRAYATNSKGTAYGKDIAFTTLDHITFEGNMTLTSQQEIDDFGTHHYSIVTGKLKIKDNENAPSITNVDALKSLYSVDNGFSFLNNPLLTNINGLKNLKFASYLEFNANEILSDIDILKNITHSTYFILLDNPLITNIDCLSNIDSAGFILIRNNDLLANLNGLNNLTHVEKSFYISGNSALTSISGLNNLVSVKELFVEYNENLLNVTGFANLTHVDYFYVFDNNVLTSCSWGNKITHLEVLSVNNNYALTNLDDFSNLTTVEQGIVFTGNTNLTNFCGLQNLLQNNGLNGSYQAQDNAYNPTQQDIIDGNCSQ